jgi:hypothetical protein
MELKDMESIRSWLISKGIPAAELDEFVELPIIKDIGEGLALSLMNDEMIGMDVLMLMMRMEEMESNLLARIAKLEGGA